MRNQQNSAENEGSVARTGSPELIVKIAFEMENSSIILLSDDDDIIFVDEKKAPRRNRNRDGDSPAAAADDDGASDDCIFVPTRTLNKERRNNAAVKYDNPLPSTSHAQDTTKADSDTDLWSMLDSSPLVVSSHVDTAAVIGNNTSDNGGRISPPSASVCDNPATLSSASVSQSGSLQILLTDSMAAAAMDSPVVTVSVVGKPKPSPPSHAIWRAFAPDTSPPAKDTSPDTPPSTNRNKSQYYVSGTDDSDSGGGSPADNKVCTVDLQQLSSDKTDDSVLIANQPDSAVASTSAYTFTTTYTTNTGESVTAAAACPATGVKYIDDTSPIQILPYPDADNEASDSDDSVVFIESRTKSRRGVAKIKTEDSDGGQCAVIIPDSQPMDTGSPIICSSDDKSSKDQQPPHSFFDSITLDMKPFGSMFTSSSSSSKDVDNKNGVLSSNSASSSTVNLASLGDHATMATRAKSASAIKSPLDDLRAFTTLTSFNVSTVSSSTNYDTKPPIKLKFTKSLSVPGTSSSKSMPVDAHDLKSRLERIAKKAERKKHKRSRTLSGHKLPAFMIKKGSLFPRHRSFSVPDSSTSPGAQTGDGNSAFTPYQKYRKRKLPPSNIKAILYHSNHPEKQQQDDGTNGIQQDLSTMAHGANGLSPQKPFFDPFYTNIPFKKRNFIGGCGPGSQGNQVTPQVLAVPSLSTSLGRPSAPIASTAGSSSSSIAAAQSAADADADKAINDVLMSIRGLKNSSKDPMFGAGPMSTYSQAGGSRPGPHHQPAAAAPSSAPAPVSVPLSLTFGKAPSASAASASFSSIASAALSASLASARAAHTATAISVALSPASVTFAAPAVQQPPPQLLSAVDRANAAADENQYTCKKCENLTLAQEITRCTSWHSCCQMCIQKEVTNLLAVDRSNKRALKCVYPNCDSLYTIAELKRALPPLLVDILEKRLEADIADQVIGFNDSATTPDFGKVEEIIETKGGGPSLVKLPGYWEPMDPEDTGYQKVVLDHTLSEYIMVTDMFKQTMPPTEFRITKVSRIQNPVLYQFYCVKKSQLKKEGEDNRVREQLLFHGTVKNVVEGICKNNIDWRLSGKNATAFGKGSYFARDAKFSHNYTDGAKATIHGGLRNRIHRYVTHHHAMSTSGGGLSSIPLLPLNLTSHQIPMLAQMPPAGAASILGLQINNNIPPLPGTGGGVAMPPSNHDTSTEASSSHVLFLAHVLVGKYTLGNPSYRKPPALNGHEPYGKAYDSCVNDMRHPSIFVVFESAQIYPEYMIEYTSA